MAFPNRPFLAALALAVSGSAFAPESSLETLAACLPAEEAAESPAAEPHDPAQQRLVRHLSRRYQVAAESTGHVVTTAYRAAREVGLDPLLVLAVIAVESRFNPIAESGMGAKGLMQIIPRYHQDKLQARGGNDAVLDPESNILVGTQILQEYVYRTGTLEAGLQFYNGALRDPRALYAQRVMAERQRLEAVASPRGT